MFCLSALCTFYINVGADCNPPFYIQLQIRDKQQNAKGIDSKSGDFA